MASILTTARIVCKDTQARRKVIEAFRKIIEYTTPNEPEVLQYVCAVPYHDEPANEIYMIEEYADQAASDAHLATKPVQELIQLFTSGDVLAQPPEVQNCPILSRKASASAVPVSLGPVIVLLNISSQSNESPLLMKGAETVFERVLTNTKGLNRLLMAEDKESASVRIECVLHVWDAFTELQETLSRDEAHSAEVVLISPVCGFVGREEKSKL